MKKKFNLTQLLTGSLVLLVVLIVLLVFYLGTLKTQIDFVRQEKTIREAHLQNGRSTPEISRDVLQISSTLQGLKIFLNENNQLDFITQLENLASRHQLSQQLRVDINNKRKASWGAQIIPTTIIVRGDYLSALRYLRDLEDIEYQLNVTSIRVANLSTRTENKGIEMNLTVEAFGPDF